MKNKPLTISFLKLLKLKHKLNIQKRKNKRFDRQRKRGMWYCGYCEKMHGKRIVEYQIAGGLVDSVCSLGRAAYMECQSELSEDEQYISEDFIPFVAGMTLTEGE